MPVITTSLSGPGLPSGGIRLGGLLVSIRSQPNRVRPHGTRNWTFWRGWTAWIVYAGSLFGVAYLDWWSWDRPSTLLQRASLLLVLVGAVVSLWAVWRVGFRESAGLEGHVNTDGPYRYARNPQYLSSVTMLTGGAVIAGSWMTVVLAVLGIAWLLLVPLAEGPGSGISAEIRTRRPVSRFLDSSTGRARGPYNRNAPAPHGEGTHD